MTWGTPSPEVSRSNNPIVDLRFEQLLARMVKFEAQLKEIDENTRARAEVQNMITRDQAEETRQSFADFASVFVARINAVDSNNISAIEKLHRDFDLRLTSHYSGLIQHIQGVNQDTQSSISAARIHAWDDLYSNCAQRMAERWGAFMVFLKKPLRFR